ncbi:MAG: serine/threonine protein kinase, partial [Planctomycetes bacterium]|nr:serine/threonine protein kinase [Planctomycetota bacterium]
MIAQLERKIAGNPTPAGAEALTGRGTMKFTYPPEARPLDGYTIKRGIERGGFGEVYYALSDAGKEVALKLLQQNMDVELRGVSQCLNLKHPNLVTIFDIRRDADGDHWIVMEYVTGRNLERIIHERPQGLPSQEVIEWLEGIAAGLAFLHDHGIVHRDLKPANIYREDNHVKIGDVGLSKFISESRRNAQTQSVGTVYYMAPEVAHGRYGHEVDIYALGVMLYEMLTGRVPFDGESTAEILMKHLSETPDLARLPAELRPVIGRALEKDPLRRTPSVQRLLDEFRAAVAGKPLVSAKPVDKRREQWVPVNVSSPAEKQTVAYMPSGVRHNSADAAR